MADAAAAVLAAMGGVPDYHNADGTLMYPPDVSGTFKGTWSLAGAYTRPLLSST